jgi:hypothetical protein
VLTDGSYFGFGEYWRSDIPLTSFDPVGDVADDHISVCAGAPELPRPVIRTVNRGLVHADGFTLPWRDEVTFHLLGDRTVLYTPGAGWTGALPASFSSTMSALTLAWRGALPLHASAIEVDGRAIILAGPPGAGKSTLAAQLLNRGARLIADDLTALDLPIAGKPIPVRRGRPTIRLHADTAHRIEAAHREPVPGDARGKWLVRPIARAPETATPCGGIILLGLPTGRVPAAIASKLLSAHLFRPRWQQALPGQTARHLALLNIVNAVPIWGLTAPPGFYADDALADRAGEIVSGILHGPARSHG